MAGLKYAVVLATITLVTWTVVEQISAAGGEEATALLLLVGSTGRSAFDLIRSKSQKNYMTGEYHEKS